MSIAEHLTETDERLSASALRTEWYYDSMPDAGDVQDMISDAEWAEAQEFFDRAQDCEDDEDFCPEEPTFDMIEAYEQAERY